MGLNFPHSLLILVKLLGDLAALVLMTTQTIDSIVAQTLELLSHYGFDLRGYSAIDLLAYWLENYRADWVRLAVIEALYRGRYKAVSIEQILNFWMRRSKASYQFSHDFERLICRNLPRDLNSNPVTTLEDIDQDLYPESIAIPEAPQTESIQPAINQFTPSPETSHFYSRLQAVAYQEAQDADERRILRSEEEMERY